MAKHKHSSYSQKYEVRSQLPGTPPLTAYLLRLMAAKRTNLCLSADVHSTAQLLEVAEECGDKICVLKTHADMIVDFGEKTINGLMEVAGRKKFLIFEDRKFGDIGNTVQSQYASGTHRIAKWASIVNAHVFPGPEIITCLQDAARSALVAANSRISTEITGGFSPGYFPHSPNSNRAEEEGDTPVSLDSVDSSRSTPIMRDSRQSLSPGFEFGGRKDSIVSITTEISSSTEYISPPDASPALTPFANSIPPSVPLARGLLLLAQMSSKDNMLGPQYTQRCVELARQHKDFVLGFIAQETLNSEPDDNFVVLTPGISMPKVTASRSSSSSSTSSAKRGTASHRTATSQLHSNPATAAILESGSSAMPNGTTDGKGQQYNPPRSAILDKGSDIIIVGRGILGAESRSEEAERYRREGWAAYLQRVEADLAELHSTISNDSGLARVKAVEMSSGTSPIPVRGRQP